MEEDLCVPIDNHRTLWLTEISRATYDDQALEDIGSDGGLFIVPEDCVEGSFDVLAKAVSTLSGRILLQLVAQNLARANNHLQVVS